jgi:hypothetical protein
MTRRGHFYLRAEENEWKFLARLARAGAGAPFDGVIVKATHIAPYPPSDGRHGEDHELLIKTLDSADLPWTLDPATAPHVHVSAGQWTSARARECPLSDSLPLPWDPRVLLERGGAVELVERAEYLQRNARALAAPYLEVSPHADPVLAANRTMIEMSSELAGERRSVAYLQVLRSNLRNGFALGVARDYIEAGAETVMIRVRRLDPLNLEDLLPYFDLIEAIESMGARAVPDCVGYLGPVLLAAGAEGFTSGARFFQKVPDRLLAPEPEEGGGARLPYAVPGEMRSVDAKQIGAQRPCAVPGCRSDGGLAKAAVLREHAIHEFRSLADVAAAQGLGFAQSLRAIGSPEAALWAQALERCETQRRRRAA